MYNNENEATIAAERVVMDRYPNKAYNDYLRKHIAAVNKCHELLTGMKLQEHDSSKWTEDEYNAYADYFYPADGTEPMSEKNEIAFKKAWNHHQKNNPHHWQYWLFVDEDGEVYYLEMPLKYVLEMIADWAAFAYMKKDGDKLIKWFSDNKPHMIMNIDTMSIVEAFIPIMARIINDHFAYEEEKK